MKQRSPAQTITIAIYGLFTFLTGLLLILFFSGHLVIRGVPSSVIVRFLEDDIARTAYLGGDNRLLHDRLSALGVEEEIKNFYRPQIANEVLLDQYIHQILYDRTGYVGQAYRVNEEGRLVPREP